MPLSNTPAPPAPSVEKGYQPVHEERGYQPLREGYQPTQALNTTPPQGGSGMCSPATPTNATPSLAPLKKG